MRTSTHNRLQQQWMFYPTNHSVGVNNNDGSSRQRSFSPCTPGHLMWSLAEINSFRRFLGRAPYVSNPGTYFWPTFYDERLDSIPASFISGYFSFAVYGPNYSTDPVVPCQALGTDIDDIELFCKTKVYLCIDGASIGNCSDAFDYRLGLTWEQSLDDGASWTTIKGPEVNLTSTQIVIGQADWDFENPNSNTNPDTQFYGIIDSIRISVGTPRYVGDVVQPYARIPSIPICDYWPLESGALAFSPHRQSGPIIDKYVSFALNLFDTRHIKYDPHVDYPLADDPEGLFWFSWQERRRYLSHMPPGSTRISYYVRNRGFNSGYLFAGDPMHAQLSYNALAQNGLDINYLAPDIRKLANIDSEDPDFVENRQVLAMSNKGAGLFNSWPGVQFPQHQDFNGQATDSPSAYYALALSDLDFLPPATTEYAHISRVVEVDAASVRHIGKLAGITAVVDGVQMAEDLIVLVKDQDNPAENGIYEVRGVSAGQDLDWRRLRVPDTVVEDTLYDLYIRVRRGGAVNGCTNWYVSDENGVPRNTAPEIDVDPVYFAQDKILGLYKEDFCVESWFKVAALLHPGATNDGASQDGVRRAGKRQTLIETYARDQRDTPDPISGLRIYFKQEGDDEKVGRIYADFFRYSTSLNMNINNNPTNVEWSGPAFVSDVIQANVFHHVALVKDGNMFSFYVNGIKQDSIITQGKQWEPPRRTIEQNSELFRGKARYSRYVKTSKSLSLIVKIPEFTYVGDDSPEYAINFNGAAGMIDRDGDRLINLPETWTKTDATYTNGICNGFTQTITHTGQIPQPIAEYATWPGFPIPNKPHKHHVYIINDVTYTENAQAQYTFRFIPTMRFPIRTLRVDRASTPDSATDIYFRPLPHTGNIDLTDNNPPNIDPTPLYGRLITYQDEGGQTITETLKIDGVEVAVGERVLLKDQTNLEENGIWVVSDTEWTRGADLDSAEDLREQVRVLSDGGFTNSGKGWLMTIDEDIKPIDYAIDVTPLEFTEDVSNTAGNEEFECYVERSVCRGQGVEVSDEPVVLVDEVATQTVSLFGYPSASALFSGQTYTTGTHRILLTAQTDSSENGVWVMSSGNWARATDLITSEQYRAVRETATFNEILFSPSFGDDQGCTYGFRLTLDNGANFVLGQDGMTLTSGSPVVLNQLHLPTTWLSLEISTLQIDPDTGLPLISSGQEINWDDFIPTTDDKSVWRIWLRCADTVDYSRNVIVRMASNLGISLSDIYDQQYLPS